MVRIDSSIHAVMKALRSSGTQIAEQCISNAIALLCDCCATHVDGKMMKMHNQHFHHESQCRMCVQKWGICYKKNGTFLVRGSLISVHDVK